ncbi:MAG: fibronectin type III domain-containing protein, partial [Acidimicrobiia bacterium]|nr:fibronectin type III domain-containing protein [Acidimicrobiia bacterium]
MADPDSSYSKADVARLEALAAEHHISIMPGFEFPGHATIVADHFNIGFGHGASPCTVAHAPGGLTVNYTIDMTSAAAVDRSKEIITKFASWFSGPYVHLGADEVIGNLGNCARVRDYISRTSGVTNLADLLVSFVNDLNDTVKDLGKKTVIYNGFEHSPVPSGQTLDDDVVVMFWEGNRAGINREAVRSGLTSSFEVINIDSGYTFYLTPNNHHSLYPSEAKIYDQWVPSTTDLGTGIHVWGDSNFWAEDEFFERLLRRGRAIVADRTWNTTTTPDDVSAFYGRMATVGSPPGWVGYQAPTRVNDGEPSHYYTFDNDGEKYPPSHHYANRPGGGQTLYVEDSVGERHAVSFKSTDGSDSVVGKSIVLNGDGIAATFGGVDIPAPWSLSTWVKRTANKNNGVLMSSPDEFGNRHHIFLEHGSSRRVAFTAGGSTHTFNHTVPLNTWQHLTLVADAATTKLYVNGALVSTVNQSSPLPRHAIGTVGNVARAKLDELKIWDEALSAAQVAELPRAHCADTGLIHHWTFDETTGTTATDAGSGAKNGTITGATRVAQGRVGGALSFDGNGDYVRVEADAVGTSGGCGGGWTAALWARRTAASGDGILFSSSDGATSDAVTIKLEQQNRSGQVGITRYGTADYTFGYTTPLNTWAHLTIVGTNSDTKLYVNGTLTGTINEAFDLPLHTLGALPSGSTSIHATLDDIRVYGHAKTATEVTALYSQVNLGPPDAPTQVALTPASQQLTVTWIPPANNGGAVVSSYVVSHKLASAGADGWSTPVSVTAPTVTAVISSLTNASVYEVRVAAKNSAGQGAWSEVVSAAPSGSAVAPGAPRDVSAVPADGSLVVSWVPPGSDGGAAVSGYLIQHREDTQGAAWSTPAAEAAATARTFTVSSLTGGKTYQVRVAAKNSAGTGAYVTVTAAVVNTPGAPQNLAATAGDQTVSLVWEAPASNGGADISGYSIQHRVNTEGTDWSAVTTVAADVLTQTIASLTNGNTYQVRVAARNSAGLGAWATVTAALPACPARLIHHWPFDESSGNTVTDSGSRGDDGTITGATRISGGRLGGALSFDGNGDYVQVGESALTPGSCGWSAGLWVRRTGDVTGDGVLFSNASGGASVRLEQYNNSQVGITQIDLTDHWFGYTAPLNTWVHLTIVGTGSVTTLYVNGVAHATTINRGFDLPLNRIGAATNGGSIDADLDDVRVYSKALTAEEVTALFSEVSVTPDPSTLTVSVVESTVVEGVGDVVVTATLDQPAKVATTVTFTATDGTAVAGTDFVVPATFTAVIAKNSKAATATISITDDSVDEGSSSKAFAVAASTTSPSLTAAAVTITITDDDTAGVTVSESSVTVIKDEGVGYTVALDSQPSGDVTVTATSGASATATVAPATRTFTTLNWSTAQSFTVTGVEAGATSVTHAVSGYGSVTAAAGVGVTVVDGVGVPTGLRVVPVDGRLGVWWAPPTGDGVLDGFTVEHKLASAADTEWVSTSVDADSGHYRVSRLAAETYVVRVAAVVGGQQGAWVTSSPVVVPALASANTAPEVIPRLRSWVGGAGSLSLTSASRIVVSTGDAGEYRVASSVTATALSERTVSQVAATIKKDLKVLTGLDLEVVSDVSPQTGDVFLQLTDAVDSGLGVEGYELWVGDVVVIRGNTSTGVFWGSRSLLQVLGQSSDDRTVNAGWVRDWPSQEVRMIAPDMGRKFWEVDYVEDSLRQMSWYKMNL